MQGELESKVISKGEFPQALRAGPKQHSQGIFWLQKQGWESWAGREWEGAQWVGSAGCSWMLTSPTVPELWGFHVAPCQSTLLPPATAPSPSLSWDGLDDNKEGKKGANHLLGPTHSDTSWGLQWPSAAKHPLAFSQIWQAEILIILYTRKGRGLCQRQERTTFHWDCLEGHTDTFLELFRF